MTEGPVHCLVAVQTFTGEGLGGMIHCATWDVPVAEAEALAARMTIERGDPVESISPVRVAYESAQAAKKAGVVFHHPGR